MIVEMTNLLRAVSASPFNREAVLELLTERAKSLAGADGAAVELFEKEELVCRTAHGALHEQRGTRSHLGKNVAARSLREARERFFAELEGNPALGREEWSQLGLQVLAALPLRGGHEMLGVLRITSRHPAPLDPDRRRILEFIAGLLSNSLETGLAFEAQQASLAESTRAIIALREGEERFRSVFDFAAIGMALVDLDGRWIKVNFALCKILGYSEPEFRYHTFLSLAHAEDLPEQERALDALLGGSSSAFQKEVRIHHGNGSVLWVLVTVSLLRNRLGQPSYFIVQIQDIGERKEAEAKINNSLREKDVLLKEIHHRVKNNLQVISSLLSLQSGNLSDPEMTERFHESQNRVRTMALIHERLYQSEDLSRIDFVEYLRSLLGMLFRSYSTTANRVKLETHIESATLSIDTAIPLGLLINELVSNSLKHAFPDNRTGTICIEFRPENADAYALHYRDDGVGVPAGFELDKARTLGLRLVRTLTSQIGGVLRLGNNGGGTAFTITFREPKEKAKA